VGSFTGGGHREREFGVLERLSGDTVFLLCGSQYRNHEAIDIFRYLDEIEDFLRSVSLRLLFCIEEAAAELLTKHLCTASPLSMTVLEIRIEKPFWIGIMTKTLKFLL
jgi:hypothetical protein